MARSTSVADPGRTSRAGYDLPKHVLDAIEQVPFVLRILARARFEFFLREDTRQLFEQVPLIFRQLLRREDLNRREQVSAPAAVDVGHAFALEPERRAGLRAVVHLHGLGAVERR